MAEPASGSTGGGATAALGPAPGRTPAGANAGLSNGALLLMAMLAIQYGIQPIVYQQYTSRTIIKSTVIFAQEFVKLVIGVVGISLGRVPWADVIDGWTIASWLRLALLPATIYLIQNMCSLLAYQNLDAITYNVLNQTKTLSAALCCYLIMKRKQSTVQIMALLLLLLAALVMEKIVRLDFMLPSYWMGAAGDDDSGGSSDTTITASVLSPRHFSHGVLPIMVASFLSGLAGATTQKSLQVGNRNALLFTIELCAASLILLLASFATSDDGKQIRQRGFFDQWTLLTLVPILVNSTGGILVGLVIKYAGTVRKGFALIFGILISGAVQSILDEDKTLSKEEIAGGVIAAMSLWMHATNPYVGVKSQVEETMIHDVVGKAPVGVAAVASSDAGTSQPARRGGRKSRKED